MGGVYKEGLGGIKIGTGGGHASYSLIVKLSRNRLPDKRLPVGFRSGLGMFRLGKGALSWVRTLASGLFLRRSRLGWVILIAHD